MESVEITAATIEEATAKAAEKLGVAEDAVKVKVIEESKGLFGRPGKIKVKAEAKKTKKKPAAKDEEEKPKPKPKAKPKAKKKPEPEPEPEPEEEAEEAEEPEAEAEEEEQKEDARPAREMREDAVATDEDAEKLIEILSGILEAGDLNASVKCTELTGKYVNLEIDGRDAGFIVGRRGEVLNALQYLCNIISARQLNNGVRVVLEGNNYRKRRQEALTNLAEGIAKEVAERAEEAVLDALPAFERRIVHQALVGYEGVKTYSEGEEPNRRVVIAPIE